MDKKNVIEKVKKCLALAGSDNPNEAAAAMKKAQSMMERHDISRDDIALSEINSRNTFAHAAARPPEYIFRLIRLVADAFGCEVVLDVSVSESGWDYHNRVNFIGPESRPEIAIYCFEVLRKQLVRGRTQFLKNLSKRMKKANRTRRADAWAMGWCFAVEDTVQALVPSDTEAELMQRFKETKYPVLVKKAPKKTKITRRDSGAIFAGMVDGQNARLHHGVNGTDGPRLID